MDLSQFSSYTKFIARSVPTGFHIKVDTDVYKL